MLRKSYCSFIGLVGSCVLSMASGFVYAQDASIRVEISGLAGESGNLYYTVYESAKNWLGETGVASGVAAITESMEGELVVFELELPLGEYAFSVFHDVNGNGKLDANFIGIPREPVASSNNAKPKFGPPKYEDAVFTLNQSGVVQRIEMQQM